MVEKIEEHHRAEQQADPRRAARLDREQADQDRNRDRDDVRLEARLDRGQALDRREHRNRRRDHQIAVEQGGREHAEHDDPVRPPFLAAERPVDQREQRQAAALALVVGAHDDADVFQRHDDHHRPEDQAQHTIDVELVGDQLVVAGEGLAEGVDRATCRCRRRRSRWRRWRACTAGPGRARAPARTAPRLRRPQSR